MDAATPSFVGPAMLGPEVHRGKDTPIRLCQPCAMHKHDPNNVGRAVQTDPTLLHHASAITEKRKLKSLTGLKPRATTPNDLQLHATGCAIRHKPCNIQQCCLHLHRFYIYNLIEVCREDKANIVMILATQILSFHSLLTSCRLHANFNFMSCVNEILW